MTGGHNSARITACLVMLALAMATAVSTAAGSQGTKFRPAVSGTKGVVATESPAAAAVGRGVLERGGNAVDAAVATVFALNVARPQSCGIGGGGFMVYRSAAGKTATLDFRETAPRGFGPRTLKRKGLHEDFTGHLTVGAPGTVAGMDAALKRYGTTTLAQALLPARRLALHGVRVTPALSAAMRENAKRLRLFPTAARQFLVRGKRPYRAGALLRQPTLARSLGRIAKGGPRAFYRGPIARLIAREMSRTRRKPIKGDAALMHARDLAAYRARWRAPLLGSFRGRQLVAMPPPTSGGIAILEMLNILEGYDLRAGGQSSAGTLHRIIEAQKLAFADRGEYVGDPDRVKVPTATLISKPYAARRRALINDARAGKFTPGLGPYGKAKGATDPPRGSTTHLSVIDAKGDAVALTCTIEQEFGSAVVARGTGFLLNNELTDFGDPGTANEARAGKRPRSSMAPIIGVEGGRPIIATGGAGGSTIIMGTLFTVLDRIEFGLDLAHAVDAERLDAQGVLEGDPVLVENTRLLPGVVSALKARGHKLEAEGEYADKPRVQAAGYRSPGGPLKDAVSDSRTEAGSLAQR